MQLVLYILAFTFSPVSDNTFCSCMNLGEITQEQVDSYDFIVRGKVQNVEVRDVTRYITFEVEQDFKGAESKSQITITTQSQSAACGLYAREGQEWLMYGRKSDQGYNTDSCTRSTVIDANNPSGRAIQDLAYLEKLQSAIKKCHR
jgi:hypothetical protein